MGLDVHIIMAKNRKQLEYDEFWNTCTSDWVRDEDGCIDYSQPAIVYYARKFWDLYSPMCRHLKIDNCEYSGPLSKQDIEKMIDIATHKRDYFDGFNGLPRLCELYQLYDELQANGLNLYFWNSY